MIPRLKEINVEKTDTQDNILYQLVAQCQLVVTGNPEIEICRFSGKPLITGTTEQQREIQELYDLHAPTIKETLLKYFAVYVRKNGLLYKEPPLSMVG